MKYGYEIKDFDAGGRIGEFQLGKKKLITPNLFPVVNPFSNLISPKKLYDHYGAQALFTNAYIIYQNQDKNPEILKNGLHNHLNFPGIIATDSGGFQDYMYGGNIKIKPEEIEPFQEQLGSDCPVILDIPVQTTDSYSIAHKKIETTIQRAKENIQRRKRDDTAWFGPIHGSVYPDLLKHSALEMSKLEFGIYAIGGVVKTFIDYRFDLDVRILLEVKKWLRPDRPLHMFGLGLPAFFSLAVACGADTFDSAAYILYAKDNRYFTLTGTKNLNDLVELPCHCPICATHSAEELRKLPKNDKISALAEHNLYHSFSELRTIRQSIREGTLWDLVEHRIHAHPKFVKAIKETNNYSEFFETNINFAKSKGQNYLCDASFYRPIFRYFRKKVRSFKIPVSKKMLICIPEMDLPSINSQPVQNYLEILQKNANWEKIQIFIISNILGIIPLELSEMYPAGQHEGSGDLSQNIAERNLLLNLFTENLKNNINQLNRIFIFKPDNFITEYNEEEPFIADKHLINYLGDRIKTVFPNLKCNEISHLEEIFDE